MMIYGYINQKSYVLRGGKKIYKMVDREEEVFDQLSTWLFEKAGIYETSPKKGMLKRLSFLRERFLFSFVRYILQISLGQSSQWQIFRK